jgi:hypothetical protein
MTTFVEAVENQEARTANNMKARKSTTKKVVDLFYKIGASRGKNIVPDFTAAFAEDRELALRVVAWSRDVRGGAGERQLFRDILVYLEQHDAELAKALLRKAPELGRFDDMFVVKTEALKHEAFNILGDALREGNGLAAKWTPRKGVLAAEIRQYFGMSPKHYRKTLVGMTNVVETKMCAKDWDNINFSHVPSVAASRYKKAFYRNTSKYAEYVAALVKGDDPKVKVNAEAIFPYDVLKGVIGSYRRQFNETELNLIIKQWEALPNYIGDGNALALVDVSGSMGCPAGKNTNLSCMDVAVSLGLYIADKNTGKFKDTFLTFSGKPELLHLKGNVVQKVDQMCSSTWGMNTDLHAAMNKILDTAVKGGVSKEEMPKMLLILSDMQFDQCVQFDDSAMKMMERKFASVGYDLPRIVFWNLNSYDNIPVKHDKSGVALVSGFSPAIAKALLAGDMEEFTPEAIMMKTIMQEKYKVL